MSRDRLPVDAVLLIFAAARIADIAGRIRPARRSGLPGQADSARLR
jgi:hypothetical protein